jgi:hypothetical protein
LLLSDKLTAGRLVPPSLRRSHGFAVRLALFAILIQAFVVQTHVHTDVDWNALADASHGVGLSQQVSDPSGLPSKTATDHCTICHQQLSGGRSVVLDAATLLPPNAAIFAAFVAEALSSGFGVVSHNWNGRAPPAL